MKSFPYGAWNSPITADLIARGGRKLSGLQVVDNKVYWLETRVEENSQRAVACFDGKEIVVLTSVECSVRTHVHEYGGGEYLATKIGLFYADDVSKNWVWQKTDASLEIVIAAKQGVYYADPVLVDNYLVLVRETHTESVINELVCCNLQSKEITVLAKGADFYSSPTVSFDKNKLAWLQWHHPHMPWDSTELYVANFNNGKVSAVEKIAGGESESIYQPQWHANGDLFFVSDRTGFWNLYCFDGKNYKNILPINKECGLPHWVFATRSYQFYKDTHVVVVANDKGLESLYLVSLVTGEYSEIENSWCSFHGSINVVKDNLVFIAGKTNSVPSIYLYNFENQKKLFVRAENDIKIEDGFYSKPELIEFPSGEDKAYAFFYFPKNKNYDDIGKPPLLIMTHGGPSACTSADLNLKIQFWTSRGFAVADVNYRGSTGFGREYREKLDGQWGVVDLNDVCSCIDYLVEKDFIDSEKVLIRGSSAGGYTTLAALTFTDKFIAGASLYGIGNLETLVQDTHKFELTYTQQLVGPYPADKEIYKARSPLFHVEQLNSPVILFQGLDDKVVLPEQARAMVQGLDKKQLSYVYIEYEGEGHGFRKPETIINALESELAFYREILKLV